MFTQYAIFAAMSALEESGLEINEENAERIGVLIGSGIGGIEVFEGQIEKLIKKALKGLVLFYTDDDF